ncbi:hypothetical protein VCRA2121O68_10324 [Vibrio crassostreae]|nr:hypothetical protein VCRA2121O67_10324 [Vibrio crassostreae]CAK3320246.1 hypothetical protein VCRA2120O61_10324 [Vibrio crassostreae]CAK3438269.1 hypothetical protein VCRA2121O70_20213 [Vibrio crassostreae]CAK3793684.1 hypothetical protein VCRA2120O55_10324 [Vibrio crassostreae]CAK3821934.1 hypothetical protein VCRA2121O68_10324 [Vibrio crassostreae]
MIVGPLNIITHDDLPSPLKPS